jgi:hypothetical protein
VDAISRGAVTVLTDAGYLFTVRWNGSIAPAQAYYTGASCTGTAFLNAGGPGINPIYAKTLVYLKSAATLAVPANLDETGSAPNTSFTSVTIDNPDCVGNAGARSGWELKPVTASSVGLPDGTLNQLATPLRLS